MTRHLAARRSNEVIVITLSTRPYLFKFMDLSDEEVAITSLYFGVGDMNHVLQRNRTTALSTKTAVR